MTVRRLVPHLLAFVLGIGAAGLAACGAKENPAMIPAANAAELKADLDDVLAAVGARDCGAARDAIAQAEADLGALPSGTSVRLQEELRRGLATLSEQAAVECEPTATQPATTATTTTTVETVPTTTETVPHVDTTTVPPPTDTTPTVPPQTTPTMPQDPGTTGGVVVPE